MSNLHSATPAGSVASILYLACGPEQIEVVAFVQPETIDLAAEAQQVEDRIERVFKIGRVPANLELTSSAARAVVDFAKWLDSKEGKAHQEQGRQAAAKARKIDEKANAEKAAQLEAARERGRQIGTQLDAEKVQVAQTQTDRHTTARAALETEAKLAAFAIIADLGPKKAHEIYVRAGAAKERNESVFGNWLKVLNFFPAWQQETEEGKAHTESLKPRAPRPAPRAPCGRKTPRRASVRWTSAERFRSAWVSPASPTAPSVTTAGRPAPRSPRSPPTSPTRPRTVAATRAATTRRGSNSQRSDDHR